MRVITSFLAISSLILTACSSGGPDTGQREQGLTYYADNVTCADLGFPEEFKIESGDIQPGSWVAYQDGELEVMIYTADNQHFSWSSNLGMDAVIAKGGPGANVYLYDPEALSDSGLVTPDNSSGGPAAISHISFCYDWEVMVDKTAETTYNRSYTWHIQKDTQDAPQLVLAAGQTYVMPYLVSVWADFTDGDWAVSGDITIYNPSSQHTAHLTGVTDEIAGGIPATVDCGVSFPYLLGPNATLTCSYSAPLPDGSDRLNTATATTTAMSPVQGNSGTADVTFGDPTSMTDECIDVDDDKAGFLGTTCEATSFQYALEIGPYAACSEHTFLNLATFVTNDTQASGWDNATVIIDVPCAGDTCSLTPGYWKTHSELGPAPYDDTWAMLPNGASTSFYQSGQTYHEVLWTAPQGNAYYILAHAFIAAQLNGLNGADLTAVSTEMADAEQFFQTYTPADIASLRGNRGARKDALSLAAVLDDYNNGLIGPGHCSEDSAISVGAERTGG